MPFTFFGRTFGNNGAAGPTLPAAPLLSMADNGDGTGGVATISAADSGASITVYSQTVNGELGTNSWTARGSRAGNGTVSVAPSSGYYWWQATAATAGGVAISNLVYQPLTSGAEAVLHRLLQAVRARIQGLALASILNASVVVRKVPSERNVGAAQAVKYPCVQIAALGAERIDPHQGTNQKDDVGYPILVTLLDKENDQSPTTNLARNLLWREKIIRAFRQQRPVGVPECFTCAVEPAAIVDPATWLAQSLWSSSLVLRFTSRESRGIS